MKQTTHGLRLAMMIAMAAHVSLAWAAGAVQPVQPATPGSASSWRPAACPPLADRAGGHSKVKVTGPCAFEHKGDAKCVADGDDLLVSVVRKGKNGAEV